MATAKQKRWRAIFAQRFGGKKSKAKAKKIKRGVVMARRRSSKRSGGMLSAGGIFSTKNLVGTIAGAYIAPKIGMSPQVGAAAGSFIYGKQGIAGAAIGYFAAPIVLGMIGNLGQTGNTAQSSAVFY